MAALAVLAQADEADAAFGDEPPREPLGRAKHVGGLGDGEEAVRLRQLRSPPAQAVGRAGRNGRSASSGEVLASDNESGVAKRAGQEPGSSGVFSLMRGAVCAQRAERCRIGSALGGEVAGEAEHVLPGCQSQRAKLGDRVQ